MAVAMKSVQALMAQVVKLEAAHGARAGMLPYVIRASDPPTETEQAQMRANAVAGKAFVLMPHRCTSMGEWMGRYAPR